LCGVARGGDGRAGAGRGMRGIVSKSRSRRTENKRVCE
jgi:hypothetical protein